MEKYVGVKVVKAKPMTLVEYNNLRGWNMPEDETNADGYLIEYLDGGAPNHDSFDGYISWCPKEQFENANRKINGLTFGHAVEMAKKGFRIAREGWNGKGMFVVYQPGYPEGIPCNANTATAFGYELGTLFKCRPYLQMRCADGTHQMWLASQSDILEEDWMII